MSKLKIILIALAGVFLLASPVFAFEANSLESFNVPDDTFYLDTFDNLVLDFSLNVNGPDTLNAISLINGGTATYDSQIASLTLWADAGESGFQGLGVDRKIGDFSYLGTNYNWYLSDLSENIDKGNRFFVTVELYDHISSSATIQMQIPQLQDNNGNKVFDLGDLGIFMKSGNNGPVDNTITNSSIQFISKTVTDNWGPVAKITNLTNGQIINKNNYQINGVARDQGIYGLKDLILVIDGQENNITDQVSADYLWRYNWDNITDGSHTLKVLSSDLYNHQGQTQEITVTVSTQAVPPALTAPTKNYAFGDLIKASGATVYYYGNDAKRYVFPNLDIYKTWYPDFNSVVTTTDLDLGTIAIGGNVTYRPGVQLVKITTDPKVYAVAANGTLRWVTSEAIAVCLYGANWGSMVQDLSDAFFAPPTYTIGAPINNCSDYNPATVTSNASSISVDKGL